MKRITHLLIVAIILLTLAALSSSSRSVAGDAERVLVQFEAGKKGAMQSALRSAGGNIHYEFDDLNTIAVTVPTAALDGLRRNPHVVSIEPDAPRYMTAQTVPWGIDRVQARDIWDADRDDVLDAGAPTGAGVLVCVIDSGLYTSHEDLAGLNVIGGYPSGWNSDACGHGTHVAGTIAAVHNDTGVVGVSPGAVSLYIVKVFGDDCSWAYSSDLIDAANRCAAAGADIISMSLGGGRSTPEETAFNNLYSQGILSIAAAGNDGDTSMSYPASYDSVVSVAATDINNAIADFSQQNSQVEIAAPGVDILSTVPWIATDELTVDGVTYTANHIEYAATGSASGTLVDGGLCTSSGSWSGDVVLCQRGDISFYDKVLNVQNGGGAAAIIYNNEPGNFLGTLGDGNSSVIVAMSLSQEDGQYLVANKLGYTGDVYSDLSIPDSGYESWQGTSMATPHVSGAAAVLWSSDSSLTNAEIRNALAQTALDLGDPGRDDAFGYGLLQAYDALQYLDSGPSEDMMHVSAIDMWYTQKGRNYYVYTQVTVVDESDAPVSGATVSLTINGASGSADTGLDGTVTFSLKTKTTGTYTAQVTNVTHAAYTYAPSANVETSESLDVP